MSATLDQKMQMLFEAARRSLFACELSFERLMGELAGLRPSIEAHEELGSRIIPPLISAVGFIDFAHRFGQTVDALPRVSKKSPELSQLRSALKNIEYARNHLQHMRGDLGSNESLDYPILGSISWIEDEWCFSIAAAQPIAAAFASIAFDLQRGQWVGRVQYTVKRVPIELSLTLEEMRRAYAFLLTTVVFDNPEESSPAWGKSSVAAYRFSKDEPMGLPPGHQVFRVNSQGIEHLASTPPSPNPFEQGVEK